MCAGFSSICRFDFLPLFVTVVVEVVGRLFLIFLVENFRLDGLFVFVSKWLINKRGLFGEFLVSIRGSKDNSGKSVKFEHVNRARHHPSIRRSSVGKFVVVRKTTGLISLKKEKEREKKE